MSDLRTLPHSFVGGEVSPRMFGRPDDPKVQNGAARLRNYYVEPSGAARARPGSALVRRAGNDNTRGRLIRFRTLGGQDIQCEFGFRPEYPATSTIGGKIRFHTGGATVLHSEAWSSSKAYQVGDLVTSGGTLYRCKLANTNQAPPNVTYWFSLAYLSNKVFLAAAAAPPNSGIVTGTPGEIFFGTGVAHGCNQDEPIEFTGDAGTTAPAGIIYGTTYYAIVVDAERIRLAATPGGPAIAITSLGTGTQHRMHRRYTAGDLCSQSGTVFYCRTTRPIDGSGLSIPANVGNETYWYPEPATGELEVPTRLAVSEDNLLGMTHSQEGNTMTLGLDRTGPFELRRLAAQTWTFSVINLAPTLPPPGGVVAAATKRGTTVRIVMVQTGTDGTIVVTTDEDHHLVAGLDHVYIEGTAMAALNDKFWRVEESLLSDPWKFRVRDPETGDRLVGTAPGVTTGTARVTRLNSDTSNSYQVTAVGDEGRESSASVTATVTNNLFVSGAFNTISWGAVAGARRYRVYKQLPGTSLFGFIGQTSGTSLRDDNIAPDLGQTPPIQDQTLVAQVGGGGKVPRAVAHYEGRCGFGGTPDDPQAYWLTRTNTERDMSYSIPVKATDRVQARVKGRVGCSIRHLVPMGRLIALTDTTEFVISPVDSDALTPESNASRAQSYFGANKAQPAILGGILLFCGARGGHVYRVTFSDEAGGYVTADVCERAQHLFDGTTVVQFADQAAPVPIAWGAQLNGRLVGCTLVPQEQVLAWHWSDTDGAIESVSVGTEDGEDRVYLMVRRTIGGVTRRFVERLASFRLQPWDDSWHVDCGLRYEGTPISTMTGLDHLEGKTVNVFADGRVQTPKVVAGGAIQLDAPASKVVAGLPIVYELQLPPAAFAIEAYGSGKPKSVTKLWVRVEESGRFQAGTDLADMLPSDKIPEGEPFTGLVEITVPSGWTYDGQAFLRQLDPVPLNVVSVTAEMAVGG